MLNYETSDALNAFSIHSSILGYDIMYICIYLLTIRKGNLPLSLTVIFFEYLEDEDRICKELRKLYISLDGTISLKKEVTTSNIAHFLKHNFYGLLSMECMFFHLSHLHVNFTSESSFVRR